MSKLPIPDAGPKYPVNLLPSFGTDLTAGTSRKAVVACYGSARIRARILTAVVGGTFTLAFARPVGTDDTIYHDSDGSIDVTKLTAYATGGATGTVTAGTEQEIHADCYGEAYAIITLSYTAGAGGAVSMLDVNQV